MRRKTIALGSTAFLAIGLLSWFLGKQLNRHETAGPAVDSSQSALKPIRTTASAKPVKAPPSTPIHEKAFLEEQLKTNPGHAPILLRLGEVERSMGQFTEARDNLEKALKADPSLVDARLELSLVYYQLNDQTAAERQNLLVLKQDPKQADALYNLGAISANRNQFQEARNYWQNAVRYGAGTESGGKAAHALATLPQAATQH
jgi:cytochrome c-type biogenesis protein CcmH/NrfG